jgi:hypothetical protein
LSHQADNLGWMLAMPHESCVMIVAYSTPTMEKRSPPDLTKFAPLTLTV